MIHHCPDTFLNILTFVYLLFFVVYWIWIPISYNTFWQVSPPFPTLILFPQFFSPPKTTPLFLLQKRADIQEMRAKQNKKCNNKANVFIMRLEEVKATERGKPNRRKSVWRAGNCCSSMVCTCRDKPGPLGGVFTSG